MNTQTAPSTAPAALLAPIDRQFAALMSRLSGDSLEVKLAAALVSYHRRQGNICFDLDEYGINPPTDELIKELDSPSWPEKARLLQSLKASPVVGKPGDFTPLVLDGKDRLYLHRYWKYESDLAAFVSHLTQDCHATAIDTTSLSQGLANLFPNSDPAEIDWQMAAAFAAVRRRFCIISGGPGTGKTRTVVVLLALLLEQQSAMRIALVAPTGKAAARLQESVKSTRDGLNCPPAVKDRLPHEACTIHRLLGAIPGSAYFRHHADNPLPFDAVVVDEASMVDLALMAKLVEAIPPTGRLILLGDKDQLASVEAGAVLSDLCNSGAARKYSRSFAREFYALTGQSLPEADLSDRVAELGDCIIELRKNYRFGGQGRIFELSQKVNSGDSRGAFTVLSESDPSTRSQVSWKTVPPPAKLKEALKPVILSGYQEYLRALRESNPLGALKAFSQFRVLCALRAGPYGVENLNRLVEEILAGAGLIEAQGLFYAGRPVMVTRNDYNLKLFNGDIGLIQRNAQSELRACFAGPDQAAREFMALRLPEHETAYAMTVHKSQGSEFKKVLFILPQEDTAVLSRELVYTGLTRASETVELWSAPEIFKTSVERKISRRSGLRESLWPEGLPV